MHAGIRHILAPEKLPQRIAGSPQHHLVPVDTILPEHGFYLFLGSRSRHAFHRTLVHILADGIPIGVFHQLGQVGLAHHGRHHVAVLQMEVVVRAIQVGGHHGNIVSAIL